MKQPSSQQPRKQRKWLANAPLHARQKMVCASLSDELKKKYNRGSIPVKKGDTVTILRGDIKGHKGEITKVDLKKYKIYIHGVTSKKADGKEVERPIHPSNCQITDLDIEDKQRRAVLARTSEVE